MNLLTIQSVSKRMGDRLLYNDVDLLINQGDRIGLIGVNGSGKSTLLRMIAGLEAPDEGEITLWGGLRVEYLAQEPDLDGNLTVLDTLFASDSPQMQLLRQYEQASAALQSHPGDRQLQARLATLATEMDRSDGWAAEANAKAILTQLGIDDFDVYIEQLSGGQRKRVALARVLIDRADLLILDEPTNHIDADTVAWLEEYLATTPGALLMVTHDRYFLDRVVNRIVEIDRRQLVSYVGNYSHYLEERELRHLRLSEAEHKRQQLLKRELEWVRRGAMARGTKQKARKQRVEELLQIRYDSGEEHVAIALAARRLGKQVLEATGLTKRFDGQTVVDSVDLRLEPGDRIGIVGPNGAGKSTLLDILAGVVTPDAGKVQWGNTVQVGYYDQRSAALDDQMRIISFIEHEAPLIMRKDGERVEAAQMLEWFLFPRSLQWARIGSLSGGERRRLYLLRTLVHQPNVLLLDEPTNDLDIQTLTVLEEYLDHFKGALIVVSHDRYFLDRTVDFLLAMENGRLGPRLPAPFSTFERLRTGAQESASSAKTISIKADSSKPRREHAEPRKLTWKQARELEELEEQIEALEDQKGTLLQEMVQCAENYVQLQALSDDLERLDARLEKAMARWLELSEIAEATAI